MHPLEWTRSDAELALAAMKGICTAEGTRPLVAIHSGFLLSMRDVIFRHPEIDPLALDPVGPAGFGARISDTAHRDRALEYLTVVPFLDIEIQEAKADLVARYFAAVGHSSDTMKFLHNVAHHHLVATQFCVARKLMPKLLPGGPITQITRAVRMLRERRGEPAIAARFQALGTLPERTLGHAFHRFHRARGFALPGEPGCMPEDLLARHDITHILAGYNTDPNGEICANAFAGGSMPKHALMVAITGLLAYHNSALADAGSRLEIKTGNLEPRAFTEAFARGMRSVCLLDWDYHQDWETEVDELRARFRIRDAADVWDDPPAEEAAHASA